MGEMGKWDLYRNRVQMVVSLNRRRGGEEGIYHCEIPDSTNVSQTIYIGVYTAQSGESMLCSFQPYCSAYIIQPVSRSSFIIPQGYSCRSS